MSSNLRPGYPVSLPAQAPVLSKASGGASETNVSAIVGYAAGAVAVGGTPTTGNTITVTVNGTPVTYTLVSGDTTTALTATHLAAAINANSTLQKIVTATAASNAVSIVANTAGATGQYSLSASVTGAVTATASGTSFTLGNNFAIAQTTFPWSESSGGAKTYYKATSYQLSATDYTMMAALGLVK